MPVLNADLNITLTQHLVYVYKFVVMDSDIRYNVMTEITLMEMDVVEIVEYKWDILVMEDHQAVKTYVQQLNLLLY